MKIGVLLAAVCVAGSLAAPVGATTDPQANILLDCRRSMVTAEFHYSGFNPANRYLVAHEIVTGAASGSRTHTLVLDGEGDDTSYLRLTRNGNGPVTATTEVISANGRVKATATATVRCSRPPEPPPDEDATSARLIGPCGDPMYAAVFNNSDGATRTTFRWRYHKFGVGYVTLVKRVAAGESFRTGYKHLTGSTITSIRAHGELLLRERTAPGGNYRPCR